MNKKILQIYISICITALSTGCNSNLPPTSAPVNRVDSHKVVEKNGFKIKTFEENEPGATFSGNWEDKNDDVSSGFIKTNILNYKPNDSPDTLDDLDGIDIFEDNSSFVNYTGAVGTWTNNVSDSGASDGKYSYSSGFPYEIAASENTNIKYNPGSLAWTRYQNSPQDYYYNTGSPLTVQNTDTTNNLKYIYLEPASQSYSVSMSGGWATSGDFTYNTNSSK